MTIFDRTQLTDKCYPFFGWFPRWLSCENKSWWYFFEFLSDSINILPIWLTAFFCNIKYVHRLIFHDVCQLFRCDFPRIEQSAADPQLAEVYNSTRHCFFVTNYSPRTWSFPEDCLLVFFKYFSIECHSNSNKLFLVEDVLRFEDRLLISFQIKRQRNDYQRIPAL